jgi:hypothetical protein
VAWVVVSLILAVVGSFAATRTELLDIDEIRIVGVSA